MAKVYNLVLDPKRGLSADYREAGLPSGVEGQGLYRALREEFGAHCMGVYRTHTASTVPGLKVKVFIHG